MKETKFYGEPMAISLVTLLLCSLNSDAYLYELLL